MDFIFKKPQREIDRVFLHCSASSLSSHDDVEVIRSWHKQNGWSDIGYHLYITFDGRVHIGRDIEKSPAAQKGHNVGTIAICLSGLVEDDFTEDQFESLINLCQQIHRKIPDVTFHGHCEVSDKDCPVFNYREILGLNDFGQYWDANPKNWSNPIGNEITFPITTNNDKRVQARQEFIDLFEEMIRLQDQVTYLLDQARDLGDMIDEL